MAKEEFDDLDDLDNLDLGDDLDFDSMSLDKEQLTGRSAIINVTSRAAKGMYSATIGSSSVREKLIEDSLPKAYAPAYREAGKIKEEIDKSLDHLSNELRETKRDAKVAARALLPTLKPFMPSFLAKKVEAFSKEDASWSGAEVDPQTAEITAALDGIFGPPSDPKQQQQKQMDAAVEMVEDQKKTIKQDTLLQHVINIDDGIRGLVTAERSTVNYRRKMIELQYRQFFALRDTFTAHAEAYSKIIPALESIVKNTALPDYAKEEFGEITSALMKRNIIEKLSPLNWAKNYHKYIGDAFRRKVTEMAGGARMAMSMSSMAGDMSMGEEDTGDITTAQLRQNYINQLAHMGGAAAGTELVNRLLVPGASKVQKFISKSPALSKFFGAATSALTNKAAFIRGIDTDDENTNWALKKLKSATDWLGVRGPDDMDNLDLETTNVKLLSESGKLTNRTIRTIDRVIPGLLAKIDQSVRRIYNPKAAMEMYDYEQDKFVTVASWQKRALASAQDDTNALSLTGVVDGFLNDIRRSNSNSEAKLKGVTDANIDIIKKAVEIATREHSFIFDPKMFYAENVDYLGIDKRLLGLLKPKEIESLVRAFNKIFKAACTGLDEDAAESKIYELKTQFNTRAVNHYGAQTGRAAERVKELVDIYGVGKVTETDLVWATKQETRTRQDYYLGKVLAIKAEWVPKGVYHTTAGPLYSLRGVSQAIYGPPPEGKPGDRSMLLVAEAQLPYLRTQYGQHFEAAEQALAHGDTHSFRLNKSLNGTSQVHHLEKDEVMGSELAKRYSSAEYADEGEEENALRRNVKEHEARRKAKIDQRDLNRELDAVKNQTTISKLTVNVKGVETRLDMVIDQLVRNNTDKRLLEIQELIKEHATVVVTELSLDPKLKERIDSVRKLGSKIGGWFTEAKDWASNKGKQFNSWLEARNLSLNPFKVIGGAFDTAYSTVTEFGKGILGKRDIIDDLGNVVISALDIQSKRLYSLHPDGKYVLITKISDIKGGIYRQADDGTYTQVFSADEIAAKFDKLRYHTATGIKKLAGDVSGWVGDRFRRLTAGGSALLTNAGSFAKKAASTIWGVMSDIPDLYYSLDPEPRSPRLLARVARESGYIDVKTGKPVRRFSDIHGEIRDLDGNVRISQADFENPTAKFIDVEGNDVTSLLTSVMSTLRGIRKKTLDAGKSVFNWMRNAAEFTKELGGKFLNLLGSLTGKGGFVFGQRLVVERLEAIYILLNDRIGGRGKGGPLPFEPISNGKVKATVKDAVLNSAPVKNMSSALSGLAANDVVKSKVESAKRVYQQAKATASTRLTNYTAKFKAEIIKNFGIDPDLIYAKVMSDLNTTRESILHETGVDQAMLDLALLDAEFKNIHSQYQNGLLSKDEYTAKIRELAEHSPYKDVYQKSMGYLGRKLEQAKLAAKSKLDEQAKALRERASNSKFGWIKQLATQTANDTASKRSGLMDYLKSKAKNIPGFKSRESARSLRSKRELLVKEIASIRASLSAGDTSSAKYSALAFMEQELVDLDRAIIDADKKEELKKHPSWLSKLGLSNRSSIGGKAASAFFSWRKGKAKIADNKVDDKDGDGIRDGSDAERRKQQKESILQRGFFKNMADAFKGAFGLTRGKNDKKPSLLSKLLSPLTGLIGSLVSELFVGKYGIMTIMRLGASKLFTKLLAPAAGLLKKGLVAAGGAAMRYAITPALSLAGGALGGLAGGLSGLLLNPVTLTVAALGAIGYGGYKLYKWATADRLPKLDQLRMATYGAEDYARLDYTDAPKSLFLEDQLLKHVSFDSNGTAIIGKVGGGEIFQLIQGWGVDTRDKEAVERWMIWMQNRFMPVYCVWLTAAKKVLGLNSLKDLSAPNKAKLEQMIQIAKTTQFKADSPIWQVEKGPYDDDDNLGYDEVNDMFEKTINKWTDALPVDPNKKEDPKSDEKPEEKKPEFALKDRKGWLSFGDSAGNSKELDGREVLYSHVSSTVGYVPKDDGFRHVVDTVDALTAVRLRLYGCWDLTTQNVNNAFALEDQILKDLKPVNGELLYSGNIETLFTWFKSMGGLRNNYNIDRFTRWWNDLFWPVTKAYIGAVNKHLKADNPYKIPHNGKDKGFFIAKAMWQAAPPYKRVTIPPFINEEIDGFGIAHDYLESSMASLERLAKSYKLKEEMSKGGNGGVTDAQQKMMQATGGKYTVDENGKIVLTKKGREELNSKSSNNVGGTGSGTPWLPGSQANGGPGGQPSVWGKRTSEADAHAGFSGQVKPPAQSPKRAEAEKLLIAEATKQGVTDPTEIAMLLAQTAHETGGFTSLEENLKYSSKRLLEVFPRYFSPEDAQKYGGDPVAIANIAYGKRNGNKDPGDGYKYRGRGFIQLTGRSNYEALAKKFPQARDPDWVATPEGAAASAVYYWTNMASKGIRSYAKAGDVVGTTKIVNGGNNGIADRQNEFNYYLQKVKTGELDIGAMSRSTTPSSEPAAAEPATASSAQDTPTAEDAPAAEVTSGLGSLTQGAGTDSAPVPQQTQSTKQVNNVPARQTGTPEAKAAAAVAAGTASAAPVVKTVNKPQPAPKPVAPPVDINREADSVKRKAAEIDSNKPIIDLVGINREMLQVQREILKAVASKIGTPIAPAAPINMGP